MSQCRWPSTQLRLHRSVDRRGTRGARGKRLKDVSRSLAQAQPCQHLCRLIDVAFAHYRQDTAKSLRPDLGVSEPALKVVRPGLALGDVVSTLELAFDAVGACGPGAGALCFSVLTARAGTSHLQVIFAFGDFPLAFGSSGGAAGSFRFGFIVVPDAVETIVGAASTGSLARASRFLASAP